MKIIALIQLAFVALVTAWICLRHSVHLRQRPEERRVLLAWHIVAVTASYFALTVIAAAVELAGWLKPVALFGFLTGDAAFVIMLTRLIPEWRTTSMLRFFRDSDKRSRIILWFFLGGMVIGIALIVYGVFTLSSTQDDLILDLGAAKEERTKLHKADEQLLELAEENKERWDALAESNPQIAVPEVIESPSPSPSGPRRNRSTVIVVKPKVTPSPSPAPSATPTPKVKTRTIIRYRTKPTPKPLKWPWSKSTR